MYVPEVYVNPGFVCVLTRGMVHIVTVMYMYTKL